MSLNQYSNLNLYGHLALELGSDNSYSGSLNNVQTKDISFLRFTGNAITLSGLDPGFSNENNKVLVITFTGVGSLKILHLSTLSTAGFRISCPSEEPVLLNTDDSATLIYDSYSSVWRFLSIDSNVYKYTNEPTGFPISSSGEVDRTSSNIIFNNNTRIFSITPSSSSYNILIKGQVYNKTTTESVTIPNETGNYYIYFNESGALTYTSTFDLEIIYKYVYVATIYWNASDGNAIHFGDERHGCTMDGHTHARIHQESGAVYVSGSALNNFVINGDGTSSTHTQFSIGSGSIRDEDILHSLAEKTSTQSIPVLFRLGTTWYKVSNANQKFHYSVRAYYNQLSGGSYSLTQVATDTFCLYHILSTNDPNNPYYSLMGLKQYENANKAREGALSEITQFSGLPFVEFVVIATIIFQSSDTFTNTGKSRIVSTDTGSNYVDWRFITTLNPSTAGVNSHNSLGGIQGGEGGDYFHSDQPINTDSDVTFKSITSDQLTVSGINYPTQDGVSGQVLVTDGGGNLSFSTITSGSSDHATLDNLQGGGGGDYYHSDQPINTNSNVSFQSITTSELTVSGINYPTQDGASGQVIITDGSGNLSFSTIMGGAQNHNDLSEIQGGSGGDYFHSDQPINSDSDVTFKSIDIASGVNVAGNTVVSGSLTVGGIKFPESDGTSGQMIVTDGNGNLSFNDPGSSVSVQFSSSETFPIGSPVYYGTSGWALAIASNETTCVQYVISNVTGNGTFTYTASSLGELILTTNQWDVITQDTGGLTSGKEYFLSSSTAGKISKNVGIIHAPVLRALSSTKAFISLSINSIESGMGDTFYRDTITTTTTTSSITLTYPPAGKSYVWLSIDGVVKNSNQFSLSGNSLNLTSSVSSGVVIDVLYARAVLLSDAGAVNKMIQFSETVTGSSKTQFNLPIEPSGVNSCIVFIDGVIQQTSNFNLSGNVLTMSSPVSVSSNLIAYVLNSSGISNNIDSFITRKTYSLSQNNTITISTIFGSQSNALYRFFDMNDPRINGNISILDYGTGIDPDARVDSNSLKVSIFKDTLNSFNIYIENNLLTLQNKTSNTLSLRIYKET